MAEILVDKDATLERGGGKSHVLMVKDESLAGMKNMGLAGSKEIDRVFRVLLQGVSKPHEH